MSWDLDRWQPTGAVFGCILALMSAGWAGRALAAEAVVTASVSASVLEVVELELMRDGNSVDRGVPTQIVFDRYDDQDPGVSDPDVRYMYAPYRSERGNNWHILRILTNGPSMTLSASVTGAVGDRSMTERLRAFCGGFFAAGAGTPLSGTASTDWELLDGFSRSVNQPFEGVVPFSYRLEVSGVRAGRYSGTVTYTLSAN